MINTTYWSIFARAIALCVVLIVVAGPSVSEPLKVDRFDADVRQWEDALPHEGTKQPDYEPALKLLRSFAEQDDFRAEEYLGWLYADGRGVPKNVAEAAMWWQKAAEQGSSWAQVELGNCLEEGVGILRDLVRAHMWFNLAAAATRVAAASAGANARHAFT
jgi:TPR repeat protein